MPRRFSNAASPRRDEDSGSSNGTGGESSSHESDADESNGSKADDNNGSDTDEYNEWRHLLMPMVTQLIQGDPCRLKCLVGKAALLEQFLGTYRHFTPAEKHASIVTALAILQCAEEAKPTRSRSTGQSKRFKYYVPFVGLVCRDAFQACFNVSRATVTRYKSKIKHGKLF